MGLPLVETKRALPAIHFNASNGSYWPTVRIRRLRRTRTNSERVKPTRCGQRIRGRFQGGFQGATAVRSGVNVHMIVTTTPPASDFSEVRYARFARTIPVARRVSRAAASHPLKAERRRSRPRRGRRDLGRPMTY